MVETLFFHSFPNPSVSFFLFCFLGLVWKIFSVCLVMIVPHIVGFRRVQHSFIKSGYTMGSANSPWQTRAAWHKNTFQSKCDSPGKGLRQGLLVLCLPSSREAELHLSLCRLHTGTLRAIWQAALHDAPFAIVKIELRRISIANEDS